MGFRTSLAQWEPPQRGAAITITALVFEASCSRGLGEKSSLGKAKLLNRKAPATHPIPEP